MVQHTNRPIITSLNPNWCCPLIFLLESGPHQPKRWVGSSEVWIPNLGALYILASVSLTHVPCLFACFHESVSCVYAFFSTCCSTCVARAACFVFCSIFLTTFLLPCSFFYRFNRPMSGCLLMYAQPCPYVYPPFPSACSFLKFLRICISTCIRIPLLFHIHTHLSPYSYVWFVFCFILLPIFLFCSFWFHKFNRRLCHGAYWCAHNLAHMPASVLFFHLYLHSSNIWTNKIINTIICKKWILFQWHSKYMMNVKRNNKFNAYDPWEDTWET